VRIASEVRREWLPRERLETRHEIEFDAQAEKIIARKRTRFEGLIIDDAAGHIGDEMEAARVLADAAAKQWEKVRPPADSAAAKFLIRLECLRQWQPAREWPAVDLPTLLPELCRGCRSFGDVRSADWLGAIRGFIPWKALQVIDREAPEALEVPSGRLVELQYELGRSPILAAKIQELFGLKETPRIAGGMVKVLVHLLAPNGRPQQVTDDLASFWANTYSVVRKELRGRYPKHDWPEDPTTAVASRGVRR
jgi:ATP-dependent helicase HrpB